jgi:hypothetical protein
MDTLDSSSKTANQQSKSDQASNLALEVGIVTPIAVLSNSNENIDFSLIEEDRDYGPSEVLEWETQIYTEEDLMAYQNNLSKDEMEEQKSKSTDDSTEKATCNNYLSFYAKDKALDGAVLK